MTNRKYFRCSSCKCGIITRSAIGHGKYQAFAFLCPGCGIELSFGMRLYPERIPSNLTDLKEAQVLWEYNDLKNITEVTEDDALKYTLSFDPENIVPLKVSESSGPQLTPWIQSMTLVSDMAQYDKFRKVRLGVVKEFWPPLERATSYLLSTNTSGLISELSSPLK